MSARLEALNEQLAAVKRAIAERAAAGQPTDDLIKKEQDLTNQLTQARSLLTENASKVVLRG